jgi:hypothetical protein
MYLIFSVLGHKCLAILQSILFETGVEVFVQSDKLSVWAMHIITTKYVY